MITPKEFKKVSEFKEFLNLLKEPESRKATLTTLKILPNKELSSAELARQAKISEGKAEEVLIKLKGLGLTKETRPKHFRSTRGFKFSPGLQRKLAALPTKEEEEMIHLALEAQRENLNTVYEFWSKHLNLEKWRKEWNDEQPNLSFGMRHIPASMAEDVFRVMARFEADLHRVVERHTRRLGDEEVREPLLLIQWLLAPTS